VDTRKNRLYIILRGRLSSAAIREASQRIMEDVQRLQPGFDVITDLTEAQSTTPEGLEVLKQAQGFAASHGMRRAVRVVPEAFAALLQMWRSSRELGYPAEIALSMADAHRLLDKAPPSPAVAEPPGA
jgi:hypothetical protein